MSRDLKEFAEKLMIPLKNPYFWVACFIVIILASTLND
jgi:hypothetical protein